VGARHHGSRFVPQYARSEPRGLEAERVEHGAKQQVVFIAIPAAPRAHELREHGREIEVRCAPEQRVEVFERDDLRMQPVQRVQRL
jgi:hypothetical protein